MVKQCSLLVFCALAALVVACRYDAFDPTNRACPCVVGWTCDTTRGICIAAGGGGDGGPATCDLTQCTSTTHGAPSCMGTTCGWSCEPGFAHCIDGDTACSVDIVNDSLHCGSCGNNCNVSVKHASAATCGGATCTYVACESGFLDCDGDRNDGCESDSTMDAKHCGTCATDCTVSAVNVVAATCTTAGCGYTSCAANFADCNGIASDGCECACGKKGKVCCPGKTCTGSFTCGADNLCN